jgi:hypothetical protein
VPRQLNIHGDLNLIGGLHVYVARPAAVALAAEEIQAVGLLGLAARAGGVVLSVVGLRVRRGEQKLFRAERLLVLAVATDAGAVEAQDVVDASVEGICA